MLLVHSEIYYVPVDDGWDEVLVRNVLHYVPVLLSIKEGVKSYVTVEAVFSYDSSCLFVCT